MKKNLIGKVNFLIVLTTLFVAGQAFGTELFIPSIKATPGKIIEVPIMLDKTDNLAGMKLVLKYDKNILEYKDGAKTKVTSSLMHVVNDKNPGVVILVMAGAKGIAGKNVQLFTLKFKTNPGIKTKTSAGMAIKELQLMSDQLNEIECKIKVNDVVISP